MRRRPYQRVSVHRCPAGWYVQVHTKHPTEDREDVFTHQNFGARGFRLLCCYPSAVEADQAGRELIRKHGAGIVRLPH